MHFALCTYKMEKESSFVRWKKNFVNGKEKKEDEVDKNCAVAYT